MLFGIIIVGLAVVFLAEAVIYLFWFRAKTARKKKSLSQEAMGLEAKELRIRKKLQTSEDILTERFLFYDTTRRLAPLLDKKELFTKFLQELGYLGQVEEMEIAAKIKSKGYLKFGLGKGAKEALYLKTKSKAVIEYVPYFVKILRLCLERVRLYNKLQQLSIYDSVTKIYNRRHLCKDFRKSLSGLRSSDIIWHF